ncbi:protein GlmU [Desulfosarcina sp. OttesenSCG-928-A07]|nr:protein GlmU [Desulfosarcina sp. OttesenSCG-928-G17]MDL2329292.1 protein GlmU [Desulfosarcina sp. OttesenSCG-928-A07]
MPSKNSIIDDTVRMERISPHAVIHPGCRVRGENTLICQGVELGHEAPVTIHNCYVGPGVKLKGGYFENAVFLEGAEAGSGAHVRGGTILEEQASIAHTVGLKQTILFPFVTLGSLINFCDCLMAGGTSRKNHSEVGSSYIHFNYTPNQDKATASLIGDVPSGVMLNQPPIFLGGQGGMVGPCRIAYGTVTAAGSICRKDQLKPGHLILEGKGRGGALPYTTGIYASVSRQVTNNILYMGNLVALMAWYTHVRGMFVGKSYPAALHKGLVEVLETAIFERVKQFSVFCGKMEPSLRSYLEKFEKNANPRLIQQKTELHANAHHVKTIVSHWLSTMDDCRDKTVHAVFSQKAVTANYLDVIQNLAPEAASACTGWLQEIVNQVGEDLFSLFPAIGS